jgi:hypothetical protein
MCLSSPRRHQMNQSILTITSFTARLPIANMTGGFDRRRCSRTTLPDWSSKVALGCIGPTQVHPIPHVRAIAFEEHMSNLFGTPLTRRTPMCLSARVHIHGIIPCRHAETSLSRIMYFDIGSKHVRHVKVTRSKRHM